jgi:chromosome segregation ATPase
VAEGRALRAALEEAQGKVRGLRATLAQVEDESLLAPLEREREALQAQVAQTLRELADVESQRDRRTQALADEALLLTQLGAKRDGLIEALIESLDPGLTEGKSGGAAR